MLAVDDFAETDSLVTLDSGCCEHVLDLIDAPGYQDHLRPSQASMRGQNFVVGNGDRIPNEGQVELIMDTKDNKPRDCEAFSKSQR